MLFRSQSHRYVLLDGLRGVAALVVLTLHVAQQRDWTAFPLASLAVDFFFMLSGFVVTFAYEARLSGGAMSWPAFARVRLARLYPLVFLSTLLGILLAFVAVAAKGTVTGEQVATAGVLALLLLPSYVFPQWPTAYPINMASWSLTFELFINAVYGCIAPRLTTARLVMLTLASLGVLVGVAYRLDGIAGGNDQANFVYGFGRVAFPFFAGVLLYRWRGARRRAPLLGGALMVVFAALFFVPLGQSPLAALGFVVVLFPGFIALGARLETGPRTARLCSYLGALSYPLYLLQAPLLRVGEEMLRHVQLTLFQHVLFGLCEAGVAVAAAQVSLALYDRPLQRYFKSRATLRRSAPVRIGT